MMNKEQTKRNAKHFWCYPCSHHFISEDFTEPEFTGEDIDPGSPDDEYNYYTRCPLCHEYARACHPRFANIPKMRANATGPRTEAGKRRVALNGVKHGIYAQPHHLLAPANGKYDICPECEVHSDCKAGALSYCPYKTDLMVRVIAAYENGDQAALKTYAGMSQARLMLIMEKILGDIIRMGPMIRQPKIANGTVVELKKADGTKETVYEYVEHPLIRNMPKVMAALGFTSDQQEMNAHASSDKESEELKGKLAEQTDPINFLTQMKDLVATIQHGAPMAAAATRANDPVHQASEDDEDEGEVAMATEENPFA